MIEAETAARFARLTLGHVGRRWPYKLDQVLTGPEDVREPAVLHPIFHGSFDWHSCVHGWWQLLTLARRHPNLPEAEEIRAEADAMLTPANVAGELAVLGRPYAQGFERPYGWAWAMTLHGEAVRHDVGWGAALEPLACAFAERFRNYLPKLTHPMRTGTHNCTAFALSLAIDWADEHDVRLAEEVRGCALRWFEIDRDCRAWEPGGEDFLSPTLCEAVLMSRVLGPEFSGWFDDFLPHLARGEPAALLTPVAVSDRSDGRLAHLDGLNLSRAWCWQLLARALGAEHPLMSTMRDAAERHLAASLPHLADDYMGAHWLATFALMALTA